jgi:4-amino-4-deoxy-L-arabinose transferase-like glycosyltransferase
MTSVAAAMRDGGRGRWDVVAVAAIVGGAVAREAWGVVAHPAMDYVYSDMAGYVDRARRLVEGAPLSRFDTLFAPGTHLLLSLPMWLFGSGHRGLLVASMLWAAMSAVTPFLAWRVARHLLSPAAAAVATVLVAASPLAVAYSGFFTSETPSTALLLTVVLLALTCRSVEGRRRDVTAIALGLAAGVLVAVRPQLALNAAFAVVPLLLVWRRYRRLLAIAVVAGAVALAPVLAINAAAGAGVGRISTYDGMNFFLAHCPVHSLTTGLPSTGRWDVASPVAIQQHRGYDVFVPDHHPWDSGWYFRAGWGCIRRDGIGHVRSVARSVVDLSVTSVPWPMSEGGLLRRVAALTNIAICGSAAVALVAALWLHRRRRLEDTRGIATLAAHLALVVPTGALFLGEPRFRVPYDPFALMIAAAVAVQLVQLGKLGKRPAMPGPGHLDEHEREAAARPSPA